MDAGVITFIIQLVYSEKKFRIVAPVDNRRVTKRESEVERIRVFPALTIQLH
jgi:hypothetical protein